MLILFTGEPDDTARLTGENSSTVRNSLYIVIAVFLTHTEISVCGDLASNEYVH